MRISVLAVAGSTGLILASGLATAEEPPAKRWTLEMPQEENTPAPEPTVRGNTNAR
ncbi:MAG: hypothetical protein AAGK02_17320 [Pseudomonadota bacterium]